MTSAGFTDAANDPALAAAVDQGVDAAGPLLNGGDCGVYDQRFPGSALPPIEAGGY